MKIRNPIGRTAVIEFIHTHTRSHRECDGKILFKTNGMTTDQHKLGNIQMDCKENARGREIESDEIKCDHT